MDPEFRDVRGGGAGIGTGWSCSVPNYNPLLGGKKPGRGLRAFSGFRGVSFFDQMHGAKGGENWTCSVGVTQLDGSLRTSSLAGAQEGAKEPGVSIFPIEQEDSTWSDRSSPTR